MWLISHLKSHSGSNKGITRTSEISRIKRCGWRNTITSEHRLWLLTPWLMEPRGSMPHSQGLSNNPFPEPNQWYKLWSSSLWSLLQSPFASLLGPNIRLRILFSNTLNLCFSLDVRDYASLSHRTTTGNIIVLYILIFKLLKRSRDSSHIEYSFVNIEPKYLKVFTFSYELLSIVICSFATMLQKYPISMYLVSCMFSAEPIFLQVFNNTSIKMVWNGVHSASWRQLGSYLIEK